MHTAELFEFPFVKDLPKLSDLPKREQSKLQKVWNQVAELRAIQEQKGGLFPIRLVCGMLDVSRQRVYELIEAGRLECVDMEGGVRMVTGESVVGFAQTERKAGRPVKVQEEAKAKGIFRAALNVGLRMGDQICDEWEGKRKK